MRKLAGAIVVAIVATSSLVGCQDDSSSDAASKPSSSQSANQGTSGELKYAEHDDSSQLAAAFDLLGQPRSATWYLKSDGTQLVSPSNLAWLEAVVVVTPETMKRLMTGPAKPTSSTPTLSTAARSLVPSSAARLYEGRLTAASYYSADPGRPGTWAGSLWLYPSADTVVIKATYHPS